MKSFLIIVTCVTVIGFIAIMAIGFTDMGNMFILPCIMVAALFGVGLAFIWDGYKIKMHAITMAKKEFMATLLTCAVIASVIVFISVNLSTL